jgi:hypothetical protein
MMNGKNEKKPVICNEAGSTFSELYLEDEKMKTMIPGCPFLLALCVVFLCCVAFLWKKEEHKEKISYMHPKPCFSKSTKNKTL